MTKFPSNLFAIFRGLEIISKAYSREQFKMWAVICKNSNISELFNENIMEYFKEVMHSPPITMAKLQILLKESKERSCLVGKGLNQLSYTNVYPKTRPNSVKGDYSEFSNESNNIVANLDISKITLKELEEMLAKPTKDREVIPRLLSSKTDSTTEIKEPFVQNSTFLAPSLKHIKPYVFKKIEATTSPTNSDIKININLPELSSIAKQRRVPSSRLGRMATFGSLFAGLSVGTINELTKGMLGFGGTKNIKDAFLSPSNAERIVDTLCKVRGAALKIGQILSIQDTNVVSPQLVKAFERVRQAADYMPDWQVDRVMRTELGENWCDMLTDFDIKPFAAASIGQVHRATLKNGLQVAIKIQYPGVAQSIESDIDNLVGMLKVWNVFPHGFFIDNIVKVAKRELNWEVDYVREAEYTEKFKLMIAHHKEYYVPTVIKELTTARVLTTEFVIGIPLDKCVNLSYDHRQNIAQSVLKLCLTELFELKCMQTDPNWSNFLYNIDSKTLMLIDFGSTRFYTNKFIKSYRNVIINAANNDRKGVLDMSHEMGFLTGYETKQMKEAHVNAVMILGEIFRYDGEFDFGKQNTTERIAKLVPTMVTQRLCPPPEEIYSIHRKLSGIFLLCSRLNVKINCRPLFENIILKNMKDDFQ